MSRVEKKIRGATSKEIRDDLEAIFGPGYVPMTPAVPTSRRSTRAVRPTYKARERLNAIQKPKKPILPNIFKHPVYGPLLANPLQGFIVAFNAKNGSIFHMTESIERITQIRIMDYKHNHISNLIEPNHQQVFSFYMTLVKYSKGMRHKSIEMRWKLGKRVYKWVTVYFDYYEDDAGKETILCRIPEV